VIDQRSRKILFLTRKKRVTLRTNKLHERDVYANDNDIEINICKVLSRIKN